MMRRGFAIGKFARSAMTAVMFDAMVSAWMRRTAAEAEQARTQN